LRDDLLGPGGAGLGVSGDDDVVVAEAEILPDGGIEVMVVELAGLRRLEYRFGCCGHDISLSHWVSFVVDESWRD
jgi:hypothetical protein